MNAVFLIRHAEPNVGVGGSDPPLKPAGQQRAATLARVLAPADVRRIWVTTFKRTQQTAKPLAETLGLTPEIEDDVDDLVEKIRTAAPSGNILIIGHSNTVPAVIAKLRGDASSADIPAGVFDNLFILTPVDGMPGSLLHLKYGDPSGG